MAPRFLIDENLSPRLARHLRTAHGHDAIHVRDAGLPGATDLAVLNHAPQDNRIVVTGNASDFRKLGAGCPDHPGLAILRDANGQARQMALGVILAVAIEAAGSWRGRLFEVDGAGDVQHYNLP